jgi:hypothetical protein
VLVPIIFLLQHKQMLHSNVIIREVQVKRFHQFLKVCISLQQVIRDQSIKQIIQALVNKIIVEEVLQMMLLNCNQFLKNKQIVELPRLTNNRTKKILLISATLLLPVVKYTKNMILTNRVILIKLNQTNLTNPSPK